MADMGGPAAFDPSALFRTGQMGVMGGAYGGGGKGGVLAAAGFKDQEINLIPLSALTPAAMINNPMPAVNINPSNPGILLKALMEVFGGLLGDYNFFTVKTDPSQAQAMSHGDAVIAPPIPAVGDFGIA